MPGPVTDLEAVWDVVHAALPAGWSVSRPSYHAEERRWFVWAIGRRPLDHLKPPPQLGGEGATEPEALRDLARKLAAFR